VTSFGIDNGSLVDKTRYALEYNARLSSVFLKDINNDGWKDLVVSNYGTNNVKFFGILFTILFVFLSFRCSFGIL
jgi:hypothetical protein